MNRAACQRVQEYISQHVAAEQRDAVACKVRDMFPEISLPALLSRTAQAGRQTAAAAPDRVSITHITAAMWYPPATAAAPPPPPPPAPQNTASQVADQEATQDTEFIVSALTEMGFTDAESRRAVLATSNAGVAQAIEYAIGHGSRAPIAAAAPYFAPSRNAYRLDVQAAAAAPARVGSQAAAAAAPVVVERSIVYNGRVYKSLADHDPQSTTAIDEWKSFYNVGEGWRLCAKTPDALHVCKTYPWAASALVFEDGSAYWTALAPSVESSWLPGTQAKSKGCIKMEGNLYGTIDALWALDPIRSRTAPLDILIVRDL